MGPVEILLIAVGLAMDASAVSLGAGASGRAVGRRAAFRLSFHFGLFQALMPLVGWFAGRQLVDLLAGVDHWIAFGLLAVIGGRMIRSGLRAETGDAAADPSRGWSLVGLSVATSIDALAVGLSLAMLQVPIWGPILAIGLVTAALSLTALLLGRVLGERFGQRMEILGGVVLVVIGLHVLISHLRA